MKLSAREVGLALVGALVGLLIVLLVITLGRINDVTHTIRSTQVTNTKTTNTNAETLRIIRSCTTPGMPCFIRSQHRTAGVVDNVSSIIVASAACAVGQQGTPAEIEAHIRSCVITRLAVDQAKQP